MFYTLSLIALLLILIYSYGKYRCNYWKRKNVKQTNPVPFLGDTYKFIFGFETTMDLNKRLYRAFPNDRYMGMYEIIHGSITIRDPELIKQITVKAFENFYDHRIFASEDLDPYWSKNLLALKGARWKEMRAAVSPTFTSIKMRAMFVLMNDTAEQFTDYFLNKDANEMVLNLRDTLSRFTNDVIANCAFGIKCDSLKDPENMFYRNAKEITRFTRSAWESLKMFVFFLLPSIAKALNMSLFSKEVGSFFTNIVREAMELREKQNIVRPDLIHLLMEAKRGNLKYEENADIAETGFATAIESHIGKSYKKRTHKVTELDLVAQAFIFFSAGFDTVSTVLSFALHELAINQDCQDKLRQEIDDMYSECEGKVTYNHIAKMKYLDMVVSETLRKWPPVPKTDRICINKYTVEAKLPGEVTFDLNPGDLINIPIVGLHYDPKYYPDPDRFYPERFSDENNHKINPYTYLPFGVGPRNCVGSRFALLEIKTFLFHFLYKFEVAPCEETLIPVKTTTQRLNVAMDKRNKLLFRKREFLI